MLALRPLELSRFDPPDQRQLLETLASQIALAIERDQPGRAGPEGAGAGRGRAAAQFAALSSVSHDLRTPLAVIAGASSSLLESGGTLDPARRRQELLQTIVDESNRLAMLVDNLLHITRLESGAVAVNKQWYPLEEVVGSALERAKKQLGDRPVRTRPSAATCPW